MLCLETLLDCILVTSGKGGKDQLSCVWMSGMYRKTGALDHGIDDGEHIGKIEVRYNALRVEVHSKGDEVDIACPLAITENCAFYAVCASQHAQFSRSYSTSCFESAKPDSAKHVLTSVIMRMQTDYALFPLANHPAKPLNLDPSAQPWS